MHKWLKIGLALVLLYMILLFLTYLFQEKLIFLPTKLSKEYVFEFSQPFEEFFLTTDDGASLNAVHIRNNSVKGVVLYFHGNSRNISSLKEEADLISRRGYDVIFIDYRTYGKSTGVLSEKAIHSDAQLFYDYALKHYQEDEIILYGRSLGSGIATRLAAKNKPHKLILESPFSTAIDAGKHRFPFFPVSWFSKYHFLSTTYVQEVTCPIFILHGTDDSVIPYKLGKKLYGSIPGTRKRMFPIAGGGHNNLKDFDSFHKGIKEVLN